MAIDPLEFNERADFGNYQVGDYDDNGNPTKTFVPDFSRWFGYQMQNQIQKYTLMGNGITDNIVISIRHDPLVKEEMAVRINEDLFIIKVNNSDKRAARETFDLLTLQRIEKP